MAPYQNISHELSEGDFNTIMQNIEAIVVLLPFLINLTPDERRGGLKLGDKTLAFVLKALEYAEANPNLVPPYLDVPEFRRDENLRSMLIKIHRALLSLAESVDDTILALGKEELQSGLTFYNSVKQAAKNNVPGTDTISDDLGERFEQTGSDEPTDPDEGDSEQPDNGDHTRNDEPDNPEEDSEN